METDTGNPALDEARKAFDEAREDLEKKIETETARADAAEAKIAELEKAAKTKVSRGQAPARPRALGPVKEPLTGLDLGEAIAAAEHVEIAFSDGKREITGVAPIEVEGHVWKPSLHGVMLREPVEIRGPAHGRPGFAIHGYALLLDGKQVSYTARSSPINIAAESRVKLEDDIYFA